MKSQEPMNNTASLTNRSSKLREQFIELYKSEPLLVQAPGRVNLIGEHTDYNEGFVFPAAIEFQTQVGIATRKDRRLAFYSENYGERLEFDLDHLPDSKSGIWGDYVVGVIRLLQEQFGDLPGLNMLVRGDVPQGAGLSSSASFEVAVCKAVLGATDKDLDGTAIALLCQRAENEFVGARCGIMDQFISVHGKKNHALRLDCRTLEYRLLRISRDRQQAVFQSSAIKTKSMILFAMNRNKLIHDAAPGPYELVFRLLTKQGDASPVEGFPGSAQNCFTYRDF